MARKKNSSFTGVQVPDGDSNAATFKRAIEDVAGDVALIFDKLTGEHAEANTINHGGTSGRGALLRMPLVEQHTGDRSLRLDGTVAAGSDGGPNRFYIVATPIFIPAGETSIDVVVRGSFILNDVTNAQPRVILTDASKTEIDSADMIAMDNDDENDGAIRGYKARLEAVTAGVRLLFIEMNLTTEEQNSNVGTFSSWSVYPTPTGTGAAAAVQPRTGSTQVGVRTPASTQGVGVRDYDASMFSAEQPLHSYLTQGLNYDLNGLYEYATGAPAAENESYTLVDHDGAAAADASNPARSRFFAHTRSLYSGEPDIELPLLVHAFGAIGTDGVFAVDPAAVPPVDGMVDWFAPWPVQVASATLWGVPMAWPDLQHASSKLCAALLLGSNGSTAVNNWTFSLNSSTRAATVNFSAPAAIDATNDLWLCTITNTSLWDSTLPDVVGDTLTLLSSRSGAKGGTNEVCVLGLCLYWDP